MSFFAKSAVDELRKIDLSSPKDLSELSLSVSSFFDCLSFFAGFLISFLASFFCSNFARSFLGIISSSESDSYKNEFKLKSARAKNGQYSL